MPVLYDQHTADTTGNPGSGSTSLTWAHTCSGSNRALYVSIRLRLLDQVNSCTYNGVAMTKIATVEPAGSSVASVLYRLVNPATGTNDIVVTTASAQHFCVSGVSFTGVHQTTPDGTPVTAAGTTGAPTLNVASAAGEIVIDGCALLNNDNTSTLTAGANQTQRGNNTAWNVSNTGIRGAASIEDGVATTTMSWTPDVNDHWAQVAVAIKPSSAVARRADMLLLGAA